MGETQDKARKAAVDAMTAVTETGALLGDALPPLLAGLSAAEAARARRLAHEAFRWSNRSDRVLGPHLRMRPEDPVMHALRLAIYELFVEKAAAHGVVNDAVSIVSRSKAGLVNGVLRNVLRRDVDWKSLPLPEMPKWLRKPLIAAWGKAAVQAMEAVHAQRPPLDLTVKEPGMRDHWAEQLDAVVMPGGSLRLKDKAQVSALPGYDEGAWWVQDAGASVAATMLDAKPGERVLDLCAAPGGKTMQLAATGADVTALDVSETRMVRVQENLQRTALSATLITADAMTWEPEAPFDAILLDAPCSATGTLRRHPDLAYARDGQGIDGLIKLQGRMLNRALGWLKPGGRLVYCTCSLLPDEGEAQIASSLARNPAFRAAQLAESDNPRHTEYGLRLRPDQWAEDGGIDGFFVALLANRP